MKNTFQFRITHSLLPIFLVCFLVWSCGDDESSEPPNNNPVVTQRITSVSLVEGFNIETINLAGVFTDDDGDALSFTASSGNEAVVTVAVSGVSLTISEVGTGSSIITVTANDSNGGSVSDEFTVTVMASTITCTSDNSTNFDNRLCTESPMTGNMYSENINAGIRVITTNRVPDHDYGNQIPQMVTGGLISTTETFELDAVPSLAASTTGITVDGSPAFDFGIGINGVPMDPAPAAPFIFVNPETGEENLDWVFEPTNNRDAVGLDCNNAHLQPIGANSTGLIHYHGDMQVFADDLLAGLGTGSIVPSDPVQIGWAADGFPVLYRFGPNAEGSALVELQPSFGIRSGERPGDGVTAPCGPFNGKFTADYEFDQSLGELDECNGIQRDVTLTTPAGGEETFSYFYMITTEFPVIGRCLSGTPGNDFAKGMGMGGGGMGG
ncbi:MAG: YHYH protein [Bacteroidota bacterium]